MRRVLLVFLMIAAVVPSVIAQSKNGTLIGSIQDPEERPLPGVGMTFTNAATKETYKAITNEAGEYNVQVPPGTHTVIAERHGFKMATMPGVVVNEIESTKVDPMRLTLDIGTRVGSRIYYGMIPKRP